MLWLSKNLLPLLYKNFSKIFENHGRTEILTHDEITCFLILYTRRTHRVAYSRHVSALRKYGDLVFHSLLQPVTGVQIVGKAQKDVSGKKQQQRGRGI